MCRRTLSYNNHFFFVNRVWLKNVKISFDKYTVVVVVSLVAFFTSYFSFGNNQNDRVGLKKKKKKPSKNSFRIHKYTVTAIRPYVYPASNVYICPRILPPAVLAKSSITVAKNPLLAKQKLFFFIRCTRRVGGDSTTTAGGGRGRGGSADGRCTAAAARSFLKISTQRSTTAKSERSSVTVPSVFGAAAFP